jgi:WD40 repeat protein
MSGVSKSSRSGAPLGARWRADIGEHVISLAWAPGGGLLAAAAVGGPVAVLDGAAGAVRRVLAGHGFGTTAVDWSHDGSHLATAGQDGKVRLWDLAAGRERLALEGGAAWVERLAWAPGENLLASAAGRKLRLWDPQGRLVRAYPDQPSTVADVRWRPRSRQLTSAAYGVVALWSPDGPEPAHRFEWKGSVLALAWSPDGKCLATGDQDRTVHFWVAQTGQDLQMWGYPTKVRELSWDRTSRFLATGGGEQVTVWDCSGKGPEGTKPLSLEAHEEPVSALAFQHAGPVLASGGLDGRVVLWRPEKGKSPLAQTRFEAGVSQLAWSADDRALAVGTEAGEVVVLLPR